MFGLVLCINQACPAAAKILIIAAAAQFRPHLVVPEIRYNDARIFRPLL